MEDTQRYTVGIGEVLWDLLPQGRRPGGAPANFAYHVSRQGLPAVVASAVGEDAPGRELLEFFRNKGLECSCPSVPYPTGTVNVQINARGIPEYEIVRGVAWDRIPFSPELERLAQRTCAVCFGTLAQRDRVSRQTIRAFLEAMPEDRDIWKIFDINLRQAWWSKEVVLDSLERCNIFKANQEELPVVCRLLDLGNLSPDEACRTIRERCHLAYLLYTCGASGSRVFHGNGVSCLPAPAVDVADTVGAGDAFTAAFVTGLLRHLTPEECHRRAVELSARVCAFKGAMPEL